MSDLQNRRALIEGMSSEKGFQILKSQGSPCRVEQILHNAQLPDFRSCQLHHELPGICPGAF